MKKIYIIKIKREKFVVAKSSPHVGTAKVIFLNNELERIRSAVVVIVVDVVVEMLGHSR